MTENNLPRSLVDLMKMDTSWNSSIACNIINQKIGTGIMYLSNILTNQLSNEDIESLLCTFVNEKNCNNDPNYSFDSLDIYKNCIYVRYRHEFIAMEAVKYFNNYEFRGNRIQTKLLHDSDMFIRKSHLCDENESIDNDSGMSSPQIDCEILVDTLQFNYFTESLNKKLTNELFGLKTQIVYKPEEEFNDPKIRLKNLICSAIERNLHYIVEINQSSEGLNTINLYVINQWKKFSNIFKRNENNVKEYRNIPVNEAFDLMKKDYFDYITYIKAKESIFLSKNKKQEESPELKHSDSTKESHFVNLLIEQLKEYTCKEAPNPLKISDLELLIIYLDEVKSKALEILPYETNKELNEVEPLIKPLLDTDLTAKGNETLLVKPLLKNSDSLISMKSETLQPLMQGKPQPLMPKIIQSISNPKPLMAEIPQPLLSSYHPRPLMPEIQQPLLSSHHPQPLMPANPKPLLSSHPQPLMADNPHQVTSNTPQPLMAENPQPLISSHPQPLMPEIPQFPQPLLSQPLIPHYLNIQSQLHTVNGIIHSNSYENNRHENDVNFIKNEPHKMNQMLRQHQPMSLMSFSTQSNTQINNNNNNHSRFPNNPNFNKNNKKNNSSVINKSYNHKGNNNIDNRKHNNKR